MENADLYLDHDEKSRAFLLELDNRISSYHDKHDLALSEAWQAQHVDRTGITARRFRQESELYNCLMREIKLIREFYLKLNKTEIDFERKPTFNVTAGFAENAASDYILRGILKKSLDVLSDDNVITDDDNVITDDDNDDDMGYCSECRVPARFEELILETQIGWLCQECHSNIDWSERFDDYEKSVTRDYQRHFKRAF